MEFNPDNLEEDKLKTKLNYYRTILNFKGFLFSGNVNLQKEDYIY